MGACERVHRNKPSVTLPAEGVAVNGGEVIKADEGLILKILGLGGLKYKMERVPKHK